MSEVKRGPGRPKEKGNSSWKPAAVTEVLDKEDGYRYRWANKHADNIAKKQQEGWTFASNPQTDERAEHGKSLTSTTEKHDVVLMKIPEEIGIQRDAYYEDKNNKRLAGLTAHAEKDLEKAGGSAHGDITISTRKGNI